MVSLNKSRLCRPKIIRARNYYYVVRIQVVSQLTIPFPKYIYQTWTHKTGPETL